MYNLQCIMHNEECYILNVLNLKRESSIVKLEINLVPKKDNTNRRRRYFVALRVGLLRMTVILNPAFSG